MTSGGGEAISPVATSITRTDQTERSGAATDELEAVTDAVLLASRALVAVASRSIAEVDETVTLPQFRALVVLDRDGGRLTVGALAQELKIQPSTASRLCDRLVRKHLVRRAVDRQNRREVAIRLSSTGRALVTDVTARRRAEIGDIVAKVPPAQRTMIVDALNAFREAVDVEPELSTVPW